MITEKSAIGLIVREEVTKPEMLGKKGVLLLLGDLDESRGRRIRRRRCPLRTYLPPPFTRPRSDIVETHLAIFLRAERQHRDDIEIRHRSQRVSKRENDLPDARRLRRRGDVAALRVLEFCSGR